MKIVVIAGGGRHVGKTTLAFALAGLLPEAQVVKLGEHPRKKDKASLLLPLDTKFSDLIKEVRECPYMVIESGSILDDPDLRADLIIFLRTPKGREDKPGSERRRSKADLVRGEFDSNDARALIAAKLGVTEGAAREICQAIEKLPSVR